MTIASPIEFRDGKPAVRCAPPGALRKFYRPRANVIKVKA